MTIFKLWILFLFFIGISLALAARQVIPFEMAGKMILVKASVDGVNGNFILDTGISNLVLNSSYFKGQSTTKIFYGVNGTAGSLNESYTTLQIGELIWKNVYAEVIEMQVVEDSKGFPIHGLIGTDVFRNYLLMIDFARMELELRPLDKSKESPLTVDELPIETMSFIYKGGIPMVTLYAGNLALKLTIDTGAEINLFSNKLLPKLEEFVSQKQEGRFGGFGQEAKQTIIGKLSGLQTDSRTLTMMNTAFSDLTHYNIHSGGAEADGILGYEFLTQFRVAFNFKKREIYLWQNDQSLVAEVD